MRSRRRRALALLCLATASGALAASQVQRKLASVEARTGAPVRVVVAARDLQPDTELSPRLLRLREVPRRYVPDDVLAAPEDATGLRTAAAIAAGGYVTAGQLQGAGRPGGGGLRRGERALELAVAGGDALVQAGPGARVDVLVSTDSRTGAGRTSLAFEAVELLELRPGGGGGEGAGARATATAVVRVTARQAVYLTAAQSFAREIRLLARPAGDRGRVGRAVVGAGGL